jgi:hypothetical protein
MGARERTGTSRCQVSEDDGALTLYKRLTLISCGAGATGTG